MDIRDKRIVLPNVICLYTIRISEMIDEHALFSLHINVDGGGWSGKGGGCEATRCFVRIQHVVWIARRVRISSGENVMDYFNPDGTAAAAVRR